ncbi:MAG TPA: septal ring lytic transglycosylase RlpA family protein [Solirubrobacterales bacterium]|jgi:rare lipoprotein A (peptidoglycan hydrolase)|nr:septal ring lytic transglycosylase RlpA family protein [Solirubrobacterales bacterium]
MRFILPVIGAAMALSIGASPAVAQQHQHRDHHQRHIHAHKRVKSHVTLHVTKHSVLSGDSVTLRGKVRPSGGHQVKVVVGGPERQTLAIRTKPNGTFRVKWDAGAIGNYKVEAFGVHGKRVRGSHSKVRHLTSYRFAGASYYGPGLYGNGVACGGTLEPGTLGVANKTLPCGTMVKLRYNGRAITVPVIDRGPYVAGREYDLTEATKDRLGFPGVGNVMANH